MSEPKAQLVAPQGNINLPGMNATGVITASSFSGEGGVVTGLTGGGNLNVGVVTATSFVGDGTGHAANLTGTPNLNLGLTTATSFIGDAVGKAAGLTGTPNLNVGLITATSFAGAVTGDVTGNITGLAGSITPGNNLRVGVATGIQWHGDGSNLTGAGSSAYIAQQINANAGAENIIDLSYGNVIYYDGNLNATVGFASTSPAEQITFIRNTGNSYDASFSTGGVTFDNTDDALTIAATTDFQLAGDFTIEYWGYRTAGGGDVAWCLGAYNTEGGCEMFFHTNGGIYVSTTNGSGSATRITAAGAWVLDAWQHVALVRSGTTVTLYVDGVDSGSYTESGTFGASSNNNLTIGAGQVGTGDDPTAFWGGQISNFRIVKGTAVYTGNFIPPRKPLENLTNTKLLCCKSTSSATTAEVTPGTITAVSSPTAGSQTISLSGTSTVSKSITWPSTVQWNNNTTPTLISNVRSSAFQIFHLTTGDTGASYQGWEEMKSDSQNLSFWSFGYNTIGSIGVNDRTARSSPTQLPGNWKTLGGGSDSGATGSMAAINQDDELWVWGRNYRYQLGQSNTTLYSSPVQLPGSWSSVTLAAACHGVKTDGTLWSWGYGNTSGAMGQNEGNVQRSSPKQVGTDTDWSHVGKAGSGIQGIKTDGTLWIAGSSSGGRLGLNQGPGNNRSSPTQLPGTWSKAFGCSDYYGGLKTDGTLWAWASGTSGQLGQNATTPQSSPVQIPGTWSDCAGAYNANSGVKTDGTLWTWGNNQQAQLGHNNKTQYSSPKQVPGTTWRSVNMGYDWTIATKTDGTAWGWGSGAYGRIGTNAPYNTNYSSPIQIGTNTDWSDQIRTGARVTALMKLA